MNLDKNFIKMWSQDVRYNPYWSVVNDIHIPMEILLFLTSDGSFTRNLSELCGEVIHLQLISQNLQVALNVDLTSEILVNRSIYLTTKKHGNVAFAQSYWSPDFMLRNQLYKREPVGPFLVESQTDIYRQLATIYCGYCPELEINLNTNGMLWGRSYYIFSKNTPQILINEILAVDFVKNIL